MNLNFSTTSTFFSVLLLALVDANYRFLYVGVGAPGRAGDTGVFAASSLKQALERNTLNLPPAKTIEGIPCPVNYHIVGDDAFPLSKNIMKPYPQRNLDREREFSITACRELGVWSRMPLAF